MPERDLHECFTASAALLDRLVEGGEVYLCNFEAEQSRFARFNEARVRQTGEVAQCTLDALGSGLYVSDLWYTNYSDRNDARITGLTRFASFWVEDGRLAAPLPVMRFDESLYRMLGAQLVDITCERELFVDPGTYGGRSLASMRVPGILVDGFTLTL